MNFFRALLLSFILVLFVPSGQAHAQIQKQDSIQAWKRHPLINFTRDKEEISFEKIDTTADDRPYFNPFTLAEDDYHFLGFSGQTAIPLQFDYYHGLGYDLGFRLHDYHSYNWGNIKYYNNAAPLSKLTYVVGSNEDQIFQVVHSQKIKKLVNLTIDAQRVSSVGNIGNLGRDNDRQAASIGSLFSELWYRSKNKRLNVSFDYLSNRREINEHGGFLDVNSLFHDPEFDRDFASIRYFAAERGQRDEHVKFHTTYDFGRKFETVVNDSVTVPGFVPKVRLYQSSEYIDERVNYLDEDLDFSNYQYVAFNGGNTEDTIRNYRWNHRLGAMLFLSEPDSLHAASYLKVGLRQESVLHRNITNTFAGNLQFDQYFNSTLFESRLRLSRIGKLPIALDASLEYGLSGYAAGDIHLNVFGKWEANQWTLTATNEFSNRRPSMVYQRYLSNHLSYNFLDAHSSAQFPFFNAEGSELKNIVVNESAATLGHRGLGLSLQVGLVTAQNWVLLYDDLVPRQLNYDIRIPSVGLRLERSIAYWNLYGKIKYQDSNSEAIPIPDWLGQFALAYERMVFKGALELEVGIQARFLSDYRAFRYEPFLGQLVAHPTENRYYPVFDAFLRMQIQRVRLFMRTDHLSQGLFGNVYFASPYITAPDRSLRAGISWVFYN